MAHDRSGPTFEALYLLSTAHLGSYLFRSQLGTTFLHHLVSRQFLACNRAQSAEAASAPEGELQCPSTGQLGLRVQYTQQ